MEPSWAACSRMSSPFPVSISAAVKVNGEWWDGWWGEVETERDKVWRRVLGWGRVAEKREARRAGNQRWRCCPRSVAQAAVWFSGSSSVEEGLPERRGSTMGRFQHRFPAPFCACLPCTEMHLMNSIPNPPNHMPLPPSAAAHYEAISKFILSFPLDQTPFQSARVGRCSTYTFPTCSQAKLTERHHLV